MINFQITFALEEKELAIEWDNRPDEEDPKFDKCPDSYFPAYEKYMQDIMIPAVEKLFNTLELNCVLDEVEIDFNHDCFICHCYK